MARLPEAILGDIGYAKGSTNPMVDLAYGAQLGYAPDLTEFHNNAAYVRRHVFLLMLEAPRFTRLMPDSNKWVEAMRQIFEQHPRTVEGLQAGLKVTTDETPVGGGGEFQEEYTDVKRDRTTLSLSYNDKYGAPMNSLFSKWIRYGMMDPDSKVAGIATLTGERPTDMLPDWYTASLIAIEPDPTHTKVVRSWLLTNVFPKSDGEVVGSRDVTNAMNLSNFTVEFSSIAQYGLGVNVFAQQLFDRIQLANAMPSLRPAAIQQISADVDAVQRGYKYNVENLGSTAIRAPGG